MSSIRSTIDEYIKNYHRIKKVKDEIKTIRKQLLQEVRPLETRNDELLPTIIAYMTEHNHDALKCQEKILRIKPKQQYENKSLREKQMETILQKHNIYSHEVLQELQPLLTRHKTTSKDDYQLKIH
jgi:hypothetical protein